MTIDIELYALIFFPQFTREGQLG